MRTHMILMDTFATKIMDSATINQKSGARLNINDVIHRYWDSHVSMDISVLVRQHLYIETDPWCPCLLTWFYWDYDVDKQS